MKITTLYDQGSASVREDGFFLGQGFYGVLDGVSAPFNRENPPRKFYEALTGGEVVSRLVEGVMHQEKAGSLPVNYPKTDLDFRDVIRYLNQVLRSNFNDLGLPMDHAEELPGATFAMAQIGQEKLEIVQAGDCFALWVLRDGQMGITKNQVRLYDFELNNVILEIERKIAREQFGIALEDATKEQTDKIRSEMWVQFYPINRETRAQDINNPLSRRCFGLLNGQEALEKVWFYKAIPRSGVESLLLFSDGMVPWEVMKGKTDDEVAQTVYADYKKGGLPYLLAVARGIEKRIAAVSYTDAAEATAIAIEF